MQPSIVVLKFGSSVLRTAAELPLAVDEVYREWRAGRRVIAVVSAFAGVTDQRLLQARAATDDPWEQAAFVAAGERESGARLAEALKRSGVPASYVDVREAGLRAHGEPHESVPVALDTEHLRDGLRTHAALVVPGFIAHDLQDRCVLLGRGGSDLTALFLAAKLAAQCRLYKDVDGVYDRDPAEAKAHARRFERLSWRSALQIGGKIVQPRALQFAQSHAQAFEVARVAAGPATRIDQGPDELAVTTLEPRPPLRVVLLGLGTVGLGVYAHLTRRPDLFRLQRILVKDQDKPRPSDDPALQVPKELLCTDAWEAVTAPADLVIETMGGIEPAGEIVHAALVRGRAVITANKALVTSHWWNELARFAAGNAPSLRFSAAAGGAVPVLETVAALARHSGILRVRAVLNGTCNFILDALEEGTDFDAALAMAQAHGFAEADPHDDLTGLDAARKLELIARTAFGAGLDGKPQVRGILEVTSTRALLARQQQRTLKLVAACERAGDRIRGTVELHELPASDFLAGARAAENRVEIVTQAGAVVQLAGKGAGRWPTALSVLGDVHEYLHDRQALLDAAQPLAPSLSGVRTVSSAGGAR